MKIVSLETIRLEQFPNLLFVRIHTDVGLAGVGETCVGAEAVESYLHETAARLLVGEDPLRIDAHARRLYGYLGYASTGAETRGNSAIDIALWDLFGKASGQPVWQLLGGRTREHIRVYNTCAGYEYGRQLRGQSVSNWGLPSGRKRGPYEDLDAFLHRADELALSLLDQGVTGMKIWPFDPYAEASGGQYISSADLSTALRPFVKIREAVGDKMDIMVEFHSLWNLPTAIRIIRALEVFEPYWFEDPVKADDFDALGVLAKRTHIPITLSETLSGRWSFRQLLERRIAGVIMPDLSWCGGVSEAKKIATAAEAYQVSVAPHDCTGPVALTASTHLTVNLPNALIQETVRAYYTDWYRDLVTELPAIAGGYITPPDGPGLGTELVPDLTERPGVRVRWTREG